MSSLRLRIAVLGAVMALASALICALAAVAVARTHLAALEDRQAHAALQALQQRLQQLIETLAFEANDYGNWDELFAQMPSPEPAWASVNLTPGRVRGALTQFFVTAESERVTGRFHDGEVRGPNPSPSDPAPAAALLRLLDEGLPRSGLGIFSGHPALYAITGVRRSDRQGEPGSLIALAYLDRELLARLEGDGWSLTCEARADAGIPAGGPLTGRETLIERTPRRLSIGARFATHDGSLRLSLSTDHSASQRIGDETMLAIILTGLVVAAGATLLGTWLGWRWLSPISALARACREQGNDPHVPIPVHSGLLEADVLGESLRELILRLRLGQDDLAHALDRETTSNTIHRRFLTQLGHEFGQPIRRILALCAKVERQSGHLTPEEVAQARLLANELEQRFQEILGLVRPEAEAGGDLPLMVDHYLGGLADLLRPQADHAGMTIRVEAPAQAIPLDPGLLSPVLINLGANAIRHGRRGATLCLRVVLDEARGVSTWTVADDGPGLPPGLAERLRDIFARGEVLPGTPGLGMGLTLAVANVRTLGGTMALAGTQEVGVTIVVRLPRETGERGSTASERVRRKRSTPGPIR